MVSKILKIETPLYLWEDLFWGKITQQFLDHKWFDTDSVIVIHLHSELQYCTISGKFQNYTRQRRDTPQKQRRILNFQQKLFVPNATYCIARAALKNAKESAKSCDEWAKKKQRRKKKTKRSKNKEKKKK